MNKSMATASSLILKRDLQKDFQRYCQSFDVQGDASRWNKFLVFVKSPAYWTIINHRFGCWVNQRFSGKKHPARLVFKSAYSMGKFLSVVVVKIEIIPSLKIGPGLFLSNRGNIILGATRMGQGCTIHHHVTVGMKAGEEGGSPPTFEDHVWVGRDAIIYGNITLGASSVVASNTVLSRSLPPRFWVGGNPCRLIRKELPTGPRHVKLADLRCDNV